MHEFKSVLQPFAAPALLAPMAKLLLLSFALCAAGDTTKEPLGWIMPTSLTDDTGSAPTPHAVEAAGEGGDHETPHETPHAEEAAHHHEDKHAESEEAVDDVTWTTALLLVGFLVIGVGLLYLVNYPDEDIRVAMWDMINTTVSIFCGASFDFTVFRFLHDQVVLSPPPRGLGLKKDLPHTKSTMSLIFAIFICVILHVLLFKLPQSDHRRLFAVRTMGGHVYAFAGILTFGFLQEVTWFRDEFWRIVMVAVLAIVVMTMAYKIAIALAKCADEGEWWKSIRVQRKNAEEMQIEAGAITAGFLIVQCICYYLSVEEDTYHRFMPILHGEPGHHVDHCVSILIGIAVVLLIASAVWAVWARPAGNEKPCVGSFLYEYFGALGAVTACWSLQRAGHIYLHGIFIKDNSPEMASSRSIIVNAFVMSLLAVICVIGFDKLADSVQKRGGTCEVCDDIGLDGEDVARSLSVVTADADLANVGAGLRTIIAGFGMLVGICWDKAFETAFETVAEKLPGLHKHPVIGTAMVAGLLLVFVIPAWYWYIVPNAMKKESDHEMDIMREKERDTLTLKQLQSVQFSSEEESSML